jgi:hypothetical protein
MMRLAIRLALSTNKDFRSFYIAAKIHAQHCESPLITPTQYSISHYYYNEKMNTPRLLIIGGAISKAD